MLLAIVLFAFTLRGAVTGLSPLLPRISAAIGLTPTEVGLLGAFPPFCFAAAALTGPTLLRRFAAERLVLVALGLSAAGQAVRPWAGAGPLFLAASVVALLGLGIGNVILPVLVKAWFPTMIGQVTAMYVTGVTVGTAVPPLLSVPLADAVHRRTGSATTGWQLALVWGAVLAVLVVLPWLRPARRPRALPDRGRAVRPAPAPPGRGTTGTGETGEKGERAPRAGPGAQAGPGRDRLRLTRSRTAWGVLFVFGITSFNTYALFAWLPFRLSDAGLSDSAGANAVAIVGGFGIPAALVVPMIAARARNQFPLVLAFAALMAAGLTGLLLAPTHHPLLWALLCSIGTSGFPLALTLVGLRTRTPAHAGRLSGFAQGYGYLGAGLGPLAVGALHRSTGGWTAPFTVLWASLLLLVLGGWLAGRRGTVEDDLGIPSTAPDTLRG